ncbi:arsenate-mycothiol transferase ArsC [Bradyrhizobium ottawaense]|uniref:arsenate-mycothiol transferase ArsC n=1 Tax=Bradyrhizobium ottawaense TaxID=931866 RepID=UPI0006763172|nr:low molecular weight phosphatase family protein [Bradyrhizobium ottawaense]
MKRRVLFLCTGNYYRSRFAEELFNHRTALVNLDWIASSRGLALERGSSNVGPMSPHTRDALEHRGILPLGRNRLPEACTFDDLDRADVVIALDETEHRKLLHAKFSGWETRVTYWNVHDVDVTNPVNAIASIDFEISYVIERLQSGLASSTPAVLPSTNMDFD